MSKFIDAVGKACPMPVVMVKKEIDAGEEALVAAVDNQIAVENLKKLASSCGYVTEVKEENGIHRVTFAKDCAACAELFNETEEAKSVIDRDNYVVFIGKEWIGDGDHELGLNLMRMFFYTLTQSDHLPKAVLFMNGGVKLPSVDEQIPGHLKELEGKGVEICVCGTCLNFFGLADQLKVGTVSNMYDITEQMQKADKVMTL